MLLDCHCILGYLISKVIIQLFLGKPQSNDLLLPSFAYDRVGRQGLVDTGRSMATRLWDWYLRTPPHQRLLIWGMIMANLPDIDVLFAPVFGWHNVHRGPTHSLIMMAIASVLITLVSCRMLKSSFPVVFVLTYSCIASHLIADVATQSGTTLLWPFGKSYSVGAISTVDFTLLSIMYTFFTLARRNVASPYILLPLLLVSVTGYVALKRVIAYEAVWRIRTSPNPNVTIWVQPSNFIPTKSFTITQVGNGPAVISSVGWTETAWWKPMEALLWSRRTFARLKPPRRGWFWGMGNVSRWDLIWDATPSIILIFLYHTGYFLYSRFWGSARSRALHDYGDKHF